MRFILSPRLYSSFITSRPGLKVLKPLSDSTSMKFILLINVRMSGSCKGREAWMCVVGDGGEVGG